MSSSSFARHFSVFSGRIEMREEVREVLGGMPLTKNTQMAAVLVQRARIVPYIHHITTQPNLSTHQCDLSIPTSTR